MYTMSDLELAALTMATALETIGRELGVSYHAAQAEYGVAWEQTEDGGVRVYDCDGAAFTAHSVEEVARRGEEWAAQMRAATEEGPWEEDEE